jgi:cell division protein FtsA
MSRDNKDLVVGLDIGTSKIVALVAEITQEGRLNVIGMGSQDSRGLKKGVVVNIEDTVHTISRVVQEVELMADCKVKDVYTGIAGSHIKSFNSNGMVAIKDKEVTPMRRRARHRNRQGDADSGRSGNPAHPDPGIRHRRPGRHPRADRHERHAPGGEDAHRHRCRFGGPEHRQVRAPLRLEVNDLVLQPLASSYAVLSEDEKDLGVCLIDIGGGTTDIACGRRGDPPHLGDSDRRRPDHQRHRHGAAHADPRSRGHQVQVTVVPVATGDPRKAWRWPGSTTVRAAN